MRIKSGGVLGCGSSTDRLIITFNWTPLIFGIIFGTGYLIFAPFDVEYFIFIGKILGLTLLIACVLLLVRFPISCIRNRIIRCKICMIISLFGIAVCTIGARVAVYYVYRNGEFLLYTYLLTTITPILFFEIFVADFDIECEFDYYPSTWICWGYGILSGVHVVALIIAIKIAIWYHYRGFFGLVVLWQFLYSIVCASSTLELFAVISGARKSSKLDRRANVRAPEAPRQIPEGNVYPLLYNRYAPAALNVPGALDVPQIPPEVQNPVENDQANQDALEADHDALDDLSADVLEPPTVHHLTPECKICTLAYCTSTRIPRVLPNCGHTVCQDCAKNLMNQNRGAILFCPYCQTATAVNGPVDKLPKNFALIEVIETRSS